MGDRRGLVFVALLALLAVALPCRAMPPPMRLMLVGDSVTQGSSGDWTWRYRLWHHLVDAGVNVDFVGPYDDLFDTESSTFGSQAYADGAFDRDHAARWGASYAKPPADAAQLVRDYQPHIVLVLMGINDLLWGATPTEAVEAVRKLVTDVRASSPGTDIIVGQMPWLEERGAAEFNDALAVLAPEISTSESTISVAAFGGFERCVQLYDPLHLSARGEQQLAAGFADALAQLGIGTPFVRPLAPVSDVPVQVAEVSADPGNERVTLTWRDPPGATSEIISLRDASAGEDWTTLLVAVEFQQHVVGPLIDGHRYEFRLMAKKGCRASGVYSATVAATPRAADMGIIRTTPLRHGIHLDWEPVLPADGYLIAGAGRPLRTKEPNIDLRNLRAGHRYRIRVTVLRQHPQTVKTTAVPLGPTPRAPRHVRAVGHHLTWQGVPAATRFEIRQITSNGLRRILFVHRTRVHLPAGRYLITSWHQDLPGGGTWVTVP